MTDNASGLRDVELSLLQDLLDTHDRGGFYMTYQTMFGGEEAALQARISTFSGPVGGVALGANRLIQLAFGPENNSGTYPGIYHLSQVVAESALNGIQSDSDHRITDDEFFNTAVDAWEGLEPLFPGQLLIATTNDPLGAAAVLAAFAVDYLAALTVGSPAEALKAALSSSSLPGLVASTLATLTATTFGKSTSTMLDAGYTEVAGPNGYSLYVDSHGKVGAVLGMDENDAGVIGAQLAAQALLATAFSSLAGGTAAYSILQESIASVIWPSIYGGVDPAKLTESNTSSFNGDLQTPLPATINPDVAHWSAEATDGADILAGTDSILGVFGDDSIFADGGNDVVFAGDGEDDVRGEGGDDILWSEKLIAHSYKNVRKSPDCETSK